MRVFLKSRPLTASLLQARELEYRALAELRATQAGHSSPSGRPLVVSTSLMRLVDSTSLMRLVKDRSITPTYPIAPMIRVSVSKLVFVVLVGYPVIVKVICNFK